MKIYITGGNARFSHYLRKKMPKALLLVREKKRDNEIATDYSEESLKEILKNADAVIHVAGKIDGSFDELVESNVKLTDRIINALPNNAHFLLTSSISVYGKKLKEMPAHEETPINPDTDYARTKAMAEEIAQTHKNTTIMRVGTLYGEVFDHYFKVFELLEKKKMPLFGEGENRIPFVHAEDVAKAFASAVRKKIQGIYVLTGEGIKQKEAYIEASRHLGIEFRERKVSLGFAHGVARLNKYVTIHSLLSEEKVLSLSADRLFSFEKAKKHLNFNPIDTKLGIQKMVKHYKKIKKIQK